MDQAVQKMLARIWEQIDQSGLERGLDRLKQAVQPSIRLRVEPGTGGPTSSLTAIGGSHFGGAPDLPPSLDWPWDGEDPLSFLAQINLAEIAQLPVQTGLPESGILYFFYNNIKQPWGSPDEKGGWRVLYHPGPTDLLVRATPPEQVPLESQFPARTVQAEVDVTLPHPFSHLVEQELQLLGEAYWALFESGHPDQTYHRMFGQPQNVQGDMGWELGQAVPGATNWRLLLQLDSDDQLGMMWGDVGRLYFWITAQDLAQRRFEQTWMLLQCS